MNLMITFAGLILRMTKIKQVFKETDDPFRKRETVMIKDMINETAVSIEMKLNKIYLKAAFSLVLLGVLTYAVIRLIWYFENYLKLSYGENYALFLLAGIVAAISIQLLFMKYAMDKSARKKREAQQEKARLEFETGEISQGFFSAPEKLLHQAFIGFVDGFKNSSTKVTGIGVPIEQSQIELRIHN